jgi:hypothetical protein
MDMHLPFAADGAAHDAGPDDAPAAADHRVAARLLEYTHGRHVALAPHATLELVERPAVVEVPGAAYYACGLMSWQGRRLPVVDLCTLLRAYPSEYQLPWRYGLVVAYQTAPRAPVQHGVLVLPALPQTITVGDEAQCELPTDSDLWPLIALSCFRHDGNPVPIIDCGRVFGAPHH